jgi:hypothetical protein
MAVTLVHPYILAQHPPLSPYLLPYVWKKETWMKKGEGEEKRK